MNLRDGARLLDIGAFIGTFSLGVASLRPIASVCLVEANPDIVPILQSNFVEFPIPASVVNAVVVESPRPTALVQAWHAPGNLSSLSFLPNEGAPADMSVVVPAASLATLRGEYGPFDLVKIDAEGMELEILLGDPEFMAGTDAALWLECNEHPRSLSLAAALLDAGFRVFYFAFSSFATANYRGDDDPIFPFAYEAGLYCSRDHVPVMDEDLRAEGCVLTRIDDLEQLRQAMWRTPRGGPREWLGLSREAVVSVAGHALRSEAYETFLRPQPPVEWAAPLDAAPPDAPAEPPPPEPDPGAQPLAAEHLLEEIARQQQRIEELETELAAVAQQCRSLHGEAADRDAQLQQQQAAMTRLQAAHARVTALAEGRGVLLGAARDRLASLGVDRAASTAQPAS